MGNNNIYFFKVRKQQFMLTIYIMQHFYPNLLILDVSQPKKQCRQENSSTGEDSGHTKKIPNKITFTSAQIQALTQLWSIDPCPNRSEIKTISKKLKIPVYGIKVNNMPKSI